METKKDKESKGATIEAVLEEAQPMDKDTPKRCLHKIRSHPRKLRLHKISHLRRPKLPRKII